MNPYASPWMGGMHPRTRGMFGMRQGLSPYGSHHRFMGPSMADPRVNELFYDGAPRRGGYGGYGGGYGGYGGYY